MKTVLLVLAVLLAASAVLAEEGERHHGGHGGHGGHGSHGHGGPHHPGGGNYVYQACHEDFAKYCPNLHPTTAKELFTSECFKDNEQNLSPACHAALDHFRKTEGQQQNNPSINNDGPVPIEGGDGIGSGSGTGSAAGTPVYEACKADQLRVCPSMSDPWTEVELFEAPCFKSNLATISPACKDMYEKFVLNRHFLLGILVSGSVMVVASGALSLITICCCVACCVRVCVSRRSRRCRWQKVNTTTSLEDTELETTKSVNYDPLQQIEEAGFPQTQFVFPPQQAFSPYTTHPQYMPVFTMPAQQQ